MTASANKAAWQVMQSTIATMGYGINVVIGEPRTGMQSGTVAIIPAQGDIDETTLTGPREIHRVVIRMYIAWLDEPQENTEFTLDQFRCDIMADIFGDFTLGGDIAYALPTEFVWTYDEHRIENADYRVINLLCAYRIDDASVFAP